MTVRIMSTPILAATHWPTNAHLIEDCVRLHYLRRNWFILDPTYGRGIWWKRWQPNRLIRHDLALDGVDFRNLPYRDGMFDAVAFDPPYTSTGGRDTTKIKEFYDRYGLTDAPTTPALTQKLINDGLVEMYRVVKWDGIVLVKCKNYVSSGHLWLGEYKTIKAALKIGFEVVDILDHVRKAAGPQPKRTRKDGRKSRQMHARQNRSVMLVLRATT